MKQKTKLVMKVQGHDENAAEFAARLVILCEELQKENPKMVETPIVIPTSAGDGRQTATIQWQEEVSEDNDKVFNQWDINNALNKFNDTNATHNEKWVAKFADFLINLTKKDLKQS